MLDPRNTEEWLEMSEFPRVRFATTAFNNSTSNTGTQTQGLGQGISQLFATLQGQSSTPGSQISPAMASAQGAAPSAQRATADLSKAAGQVSSSVLGGNIATAIGGSLGGITSLISSIHHDNTLKSMQDRDYAAAQSVGLASPAQFVAQGSFGVNTNGKTASAARTAAGSNSVYGGPL